MTEPSDLELAEVMRDVIALTTAVDGDDLSAAWALIEGFGVQRLYCVLFLTAAYLGAALDQIDTDRPAELPPTLMDLGLQWAARGVA